MISKTIKVNSIEAITKTIGNATSNGFKPTLVIVFLPSQQTGPEFIIQIPLLPITV